MLQLLYWAFLLLFAIGVVIVLAGITSTTIETTQSGERRAESGRATTDKRG